MPLSLSLLIIILQEPTYQKKYSDEKKRRQLLRERGVKTTQSLARKRFKN